MLPPLILAMTFLATPVPLPQLSVEGVHVVDAEGHPFPLQGINLGGWLMLETWISGVEGDWKARLREMADETGLRPDLEAALEKTGKWDDDTEAFPAYADRLHAELARAAEGRADALAAYLRRFRAEPPVMDATEFDGILRGRFGEQGARQVWDLYHDTWITERDFQLAAALGFTFVRLPFWHRWFEEDAAAGRTADYGFQYLDRAVSWAEKHRVYVMLDFHGAPGGQSPWDHTGRAGQNEFFNCAECLARTADLWTRIARRYAERPAVFAYDTLNEPFSAKDLADWTRVQDALYRAIREGDPDGIVVMEDGYKLENMPWRREGFFPKPADHGWENVAYSFHFYADDNPGHVAKQLERLGRREQERCGVPMYVGEFNSMIGGIAGLDGMRVYGELFNRLGWAWSPWTFKFTGTGAVWGVYQFDGEWRTPNIHRDSLEDILAALRRLGTENFVLVPEYGGVLRALLSAPWGDKAR